MPSLIIYAVIALAAVGTLSGLYFGIHHSGVTEGRAEIQTKWDADIAASRQRAEAERQRQDALRQAQDEEATRRLANAKRSNADLMASLEAHIRASGSAVKCPIPDSLRDDWNRANAGPEGERAKPVPAASGSATPPR